MKTKKNRSLNAVIDTLVTELDADSITLLSDYILLEQCERDHERDADGKVLVYLLDETKADTQWCRIAKIGPKCRCLTQEMLDQSDYYAHIPRHEMKGWNKIGDGWFIVSESLASKKGSGFEPFLYEVPK